MTTKTSTHSKNHAKPLYRKKQLALGITVTVIFSLSSCTHRYYMPNIQNVPLFKEKNEVRVMAALSTGEDVGAFEIQTAYSITNKFAVMGNFMAASGSSSRYSAEGTYGDVAFGYYKSLNKYFVFETYGGLGISNQKHKYTFNTNNGGMGTSNQYSNYNNYYYYTYPSTPSSTYTSNIRFMKAFIQPSIGLSLNAFDFILSSRLGYVSFYDINNPGRLQEVRDIEENRDMLLFEPGATIRLGWKVLKLQAQCTVQLNNKADRIQTEQVSFSLGMYFSIAQRFIKK